MSSKRLKQPTIRFERSGQKRTMKLKAMVITYNGDRMAMVLRLGAFSTSSVEVLLVDANGRLFSAEKFELMMKGVWASFMVVCCRTLMKTSTTQR